MPVKIENVLTKDIQILESINKAAKFLKSDTRTLTKYIKSNHLFRENYIITLVKKDENK